MGNKKDPVGSVVFPPVIELTDRYWLAAECLIARVHTGPFDRLRVRGILAPCSLPVTLSEHVPNQGQQLRVDFTIRPRRRLRVHRPCDRRRRGRVANDHPQVTPRQSRCAKVTNVLPDGQQMVLNGLAILV